MSTQGLFHAALFCASVATLLVAAQWGWTHWRIRRWFSKRMADRLVSRRKLAALGDARLELGPLAKLLIRADIALSKRQLVTLATVLLSTLTAIASLRGVVALLVTMFFAVAIAVTWWRGRFQNRRRVIHEELPGIIDAVLRNIEAGRSLEHALVLSFSEASPVFHPLVFRLRSTVESGRDFTRLFEDFSALYQVPQLVLVAIALRTASRFGSSVRPMLREVASALRSQQELRREFLAASAEVRFTAVTFALLPPGLATYLVLMNEEYASVLLNTPVGHNLIIIAAVLQLLGMAMIWRMIQGVGRG